MQLTKLTSIVLLFLFGIIIPKTDSDLTTYSDCEETPVSTLIRVCKVNAVFPLPNSNFCAPNSIPLVIDPNCNANLEAVLQMLNLKDNPKLGKTYPLLPGMSPLTLEYGLKNGQKFTVGPITELTFKGRKVYDANGNFHPIFETTRILDIDVSEFCVPGQNANIPTVITVLDDTGNVYPVDNFASTDEAFYCSVFEETCDLCSACQSGQTGFDPIYNITVCGECEGCGSGNLESGASGNDFETLKESQNPFTVLENSESQSTKFEISPNPFLDQLYIDLPASKEEINVSLISTSGEVLLSNKFHNNNKKSKVMFDTNSIPSGLYIVRFQTSNHMSSQHVMKMN